MRGIPLGVVLVASVLMRLMWAPTEAVLLQGHHFAFCYHPRAIANH